MIFAGRGPIVFFFNFEVMHGARKIGIDRNLVKFWRQNVQCMQAALVDFFRRAEPIVLQYVDFFSRA